MMIRCALSLCCLPLMTSANDLPALQCDGRAPDWSLSITDDIALFDFQRQSEMTIPQQTTAEGRDWPYALTLISRNDTAIVIIDRQACGDAPFTAEVLTQRGETPILLTGCCVVAP